MLMEIDDDFKEDTNKNKRYESAKCKDLKLDNSKSLKHFSFKKSRSKNKDMSKPKFNLANHYNSPSPNQINKRKFVENEHNNRQNSSKKKRGYFTPNKSGERKKWK